MEQPGLAPQRAIAQAVLHPERPFQYVTLLGQLQVCLLGQHHPRIRVNQLLLLLGKLGAGV